MKIFIVWVVYIRLEQIMHLKNMKDCVVIMIIAMLKCLLNLIKLPNIIMVICNLCWFRMLTNKKNSHVKIIQISFILKEKLHMNHVETRCSFVCSFDSFDLKQKKHSFYRGKYCIERFCSVLKELGTKRVNYQQKEIAPLTDDENKYYEE